MLKMGVKILLVCCLTSFLTKGYSQGNNKHYHAVNTCDFMLSNTIDGLRDLTILRYWIVNNANGDKRLLCQYFLVADRKDTFNVVSIFREASSDSFIKEYRFSANWVFKKIKTDSCLTFYSQFDLSRQIEEKYRILVGRLYGEID
ncbi:MAG TPA: hypothetical protein VLC98_09830 [Phnomibacter sp.]|nr:hypothetical protein [Phnomibacter sp.]